MKELDPETRALVAQTLGRFVAEHYDAADRLRRLQAGPVDARQHWPLLAGIGLPGLLVDPERGGLGGGAADLAHAIGALAPGLVLEPAAEVLVATTLLDAASDPSLDPSLTAVLAGERIVVPVGLLPGSPALRVTDDDGALRLFGTGVAVPFANQADEWLVVARDAADTTRVLAVPAAPAGVPMSAYRLMDGRPAADIVFDGAPLPGARVLLAGRAADVAVAAAADLWLTASAADAVGVMAQLLAATRDYLRTRIQFGVAIGSFQALQHRLADMQMAWLEARALLDAWTRALDAPDPPDNLTALRHALPRVSAQAGRLLGHEAIQMHGGMGLTEELAVSHGNARLRVMASLLQAQVQATQTSDAPAAVSPPAGPMGSCRSGKREAAPADREGDETDDASFDETAFRAEVRDFVADQLSPETRAKVENGLYLSKHDYVDWQRALHRRGWFGASWPKAYGGQDWSVRREHAFLQECALCAAPMLIPYGVNMVGPVLYTYGSDAQKQRWLPGILSSETWWCQGYSEPNAGSDLASLATGAVRDGDHYVVNGTKLWTTEAHWADMMHCLVRTERTARKQEGITFLLIDMKTPGISVEPIVTLDGVHHTNQVFFDDVRVPVANVVGEEGSGWKLAKFLLSRERSFIADTGNKLRMLRQMKATAAQRLPALSPAARAVQLDRLAELEAGLVALVALERAYLDDWSAGQDDGIGASVLKVRGSELLQRMSEFWRESLGAHGAAYDAADRKEGAGLASADAWVRAAAINYQYLYGRCWSVFGGSNEVQRNIIAGTLLRG